MAASAGAPVDRPAPGAPVDPVFMEYLNSSASRPPRAGSSTAETGGSPNGAASPPSAERARSPEGIGSSEPGTPPEAALRVWRPDPWRLRLSLLSWCVSCAAWLYLCIGAPRLPAYWYFLTSLMFLVYLSSVLETLRRPRYLTADDQELSVAVWKASCAVPWNDIKVLELRHETLRLGVPESLYYNLAGYRRSARDELIAWIIRKADLCPHPSRKGVFISRPAPDPPPPAAPSRDARRR